MRFSFKSVLSAGPTSYQSGIQDLDIRYAGATPMLFSSSGPSGGVLCYNLGGAAPVLADQSGFTPGQISAAATGLEEVELNGKTVLVTVGLQGSAAQCFDLDASGQITGTGQFQAQGGFDNALVAMESVTVGTDRFVYAGLWNQTGPSVYKVAASGELQKMQDTGGAPAVQGADLTQMATLQAGTQKYLLAMSSQSDKITSYRIGADGLLTQVAEVGAAEGLGISAPRAMVRTSAGGADYVVVAAANSSSLSVLEVGPDGSLVPVDHIIGDSAVRLRGVSALEAVAVEDRTFLIAGGGEGGLTLFTLLPGGRLLHLAEFPDTAQASLANVTAIAAQNDGSKIAVFASSEAEAGITHLEIDLAAVAGSVTGTGGADMLNGTARGEQIDGGAGNDVLNGGGGDDIIIDGAGQDTMTGGAGADIFVISAGAGTERITDFRLGEDRLDLSEIGWIRNIGQIDITATAQGAQLTYGDKTIVLVSYDKLPIAPSAFRLEDLVDMAHYVFNPTTAAVPTPGDDTLTGTAEADTIDGLAGNDEFWGWLGNDFLIGGDGNDTLNGQEDDDTLDGGLGADLLNGGTGNDTAWYVSAPGPVGLRIDGGHNSGWAWTDSFFSIENLVGGNFNDTLHGNSGANLLDGWDGDDEIYGGQGNDTVLGGGGADFLRGDTEDDLVVGGDGNDTLCGDYGNDTVLGQDQDDVVLGWIGNDFLDGGNGNDFLNGEEDHDTLIGANGDDTLDGWSGNDQVFGGDGQDRVIGGGGHDFLRGDIGNDTVIGGDGNDTVAGDWGDDVVIGDDGNDVVVGWLGNDFLDGGNGDDWMNGEEDNDTLIGANGNDTMDGWSGDDEVFGGNGDDLIFGGDGNDFLRGDNDNDVLHGHDGNDTMAGDWGNDTLFGGGHDDLMFGWLGRDFLEGNTGNDTLVGEEEDDTLSGGEGNDLLYGGPGNDFLYGWLGNDTMHGGAGNDVMTAEAGSDVFIFTKGHGDDTIHGFEATNDLEKLDVSAIDGMINFTDVKYHHLSQVGSDAVIDTGEGTITLINVDIADLDYHDFIF